MTQPAPHIPGLITTAGVTPNEPPAGQPVPAAQPGTYVPAPQAAAPQAQQQPVPVTPAVQAHPVAQHPDPAAVPAAQPPAPMQLPTQLLPGAAAPGVPAQTATVPGLNPPAPVPQPPAPAAAAPATPPPAQQPATGGDADRGYPQGTPLEQMTADQREAYWKFHARQWEGRAKEKNDYDALKEKAGQYDQLVASQASQTEQQITAARAEGYQQAAAKAAVVLVDAHIRAGLGGRLGPDQVEVLASNLNHQHFLGPDGLSVDAAKVATFIATVAPQAAPAAMAPAAPAVPGALPTGVPTPQQFQQPATGLPRALPDLGQGAQTTAPLDKLEAGRQQARQFLANGGYR